MQREFNLSGEVFLIWAQLLHLDGASSGSTSSKNHFTPVLDPVDSTKHCFDSTQQLGGELQSFRIKRASWLSYFCCLTRRLLARLVSPGSSLPAPTSRRTAAISITNLFYWWFYTFLSIQSIILIINKCCCEASALTSISHFRNVHKNVLFASFLLR